MDLFVSKYTNKIDKETSLYLQVLEMSFQKQVNEIILYKSIKTPSIEGCGAGRLKEIAKRINNLDFFRRLWWFLNFNIFWNSYN